MVSIPTLWLPILVSAIIVFLASWLLHMFLPYHRSDFTKLPSEDEVQGALRKFNIAPGDYMIPCGGGPEASARRRGRCGSGSRLPGGRAPRRARPSQG